MTNQEKLAVLTVLRRSQSGFAKVTGEWSCGTGLILYKRVLNWLMVKLGADQNPFIDPRNWSKCEVLPLSAVVNESLVINVMKEIAPIPVCKVCGSTTTLVPDPAGYYCHAERYDGAPLLCRLHE